MQTIPKININPSEGSGDANVNLSTKYYGGRTIARSNVDFRVKNQQETEATLRIILIGNGEFVDIDTSVVSSSEGSIATIKGASNSSRLKFFVQKGGNIEGIVIPETYKADGIETKNGELIEGDPGESRIFPFEISISIPNNINIFQKEAIIVAQDNRGDTANCHVILEGAEPKIITNPEIGIIPQSGEETIIDVKSNDEFVIEAPGGFTTEEEGYKKFEIAWEDGTSDSLVIKYTGIFGDSTFKLESEFSNYLLDRPLNVNLKNIGPPSVTRQFAIIQLGMREKYTVLIPNSTNRQVYQCSDGKIYCVKKKEFE